MDGGLLLEDGAAERSGEGQDDAAEADLKRSADSRVPEKFAQNRGMASNLFLSTLAMAALLRDALPDTDTGSMPPPVRVRGKTQHCTLASKHHQYPNPC